MGYLNRKKQLISTLKTIEKSKHKNYEIIIADDGSEEKHKLDDLNILFPQIDIKVFQIKKSENIINPGFAYNYALQQSSGEIIILQNPECYHVGDILTYVNNNLDENMYFTFPCFYLWNYDLNEELTSIYDKYDNFNEKYIKEVMNFISTYEQNTILPKKTHGWVNHNTYNKTDLHFCSAIYKKKLKKIEGFDKKYFNGICFDDDDLLRNIKYKLNLEIVTVPIFPEIKYNNFVIHQHHDRFSYNETIIKEKWKLNNIIFKNGHEKLVSYSKNKIKKENLFSGDYDVNTKYFKVLENDNLLIHKKKSFAVIKFFIKKYSNIHYFSNGFEDQYFFDFDAYLNKKNIFLKFDTNKKIEILGKKYKKNKKVNNYNIKTNISDNYVEIIIKFSYSFIIIKNVEIFIDT